MGSEFLRIKGILDKIPATEDETRLISEVLVMKTIIVKDGDESSVRETLKKLQRKVVSMKVLEATWIGKSVSGLQKHSSKDIKQISRMLIRAWRRIVDEWITVADSMPAVPQEDHDQQGGGESNKKPKISKQQLPTKAVVMSIKFETMVVSAAEKETEVKKKEEHLKQSKPSAPPVISTLSKRAIEEKLNTTKRKLQEGYNVAQNMKRLRRTQVLEVHDVLRLGLAPKHDRSHTRFGKCSSSGRCLGLAR